VFSTDAPESLRCSVKLTKSPASFCLDKHIGDFRRCLKAVCGWLQCWRLLIPSALRVMAHLRKHRRYKDILPSNWKEGEIWAVERAVELCNVRLLLLGADPPKGRDTRSGIAFHVADGWHGNGHDNLEWLTGVLWTENRPIGRLTAKGIVPVNLCRTIFSNSSSLARESTTIWEDYTVRFVALILETTAPVYVFKNSSYLAKPIHVKVAELHYERRQRELVFLPHPATDSPGLALTTERQRLIELCRSYLDCHHTGPEVVIGSTMECLECAQLPMQKEYYCSDHKFRGALSAFQRVCAVNSCSRGICFKCEPSSRPCPDHSGQRKCAVPDCLRGVTYQCTKVGCDYWWCGKHPNPGKSERHCGHTCYKCRNNGTRCDFCEIRVVCAEHVWRCSFPECPINSCQEHNSFFGGEMHYCISCKQRQGKEVYYCTQHYDEHDCDALPRAVD